MNALPSQLTKSARHSCATLRSGTPASWPPRNRRPDHQQPTPTRGKLSALMGGIMLLMAAQMIFTNTLHAGQVLAYSFHSQTLGRDWRYNVYLPDGYDHSDLRYPVLFMLHGFSENENAWITKGHINQAADHLIAAGEIPPIVIIMPGSGDNWYVDLKEKIETAFIHDLVLEVAQAFRIIPEREGRGVGGDSMGGYGALRFILKYPEQFGVA